MDHYKSSFHFEPSPLKPATCPAQSDQSRAKTRATQPERVPVDGVLHQANRSLLAFLYVYAILIASLYLTYAAFYFYQQHQITRLQQPSPGRSEVADNPAESSVVEAASSAKQVRQVDLGPHQDALNLVNEKLEGKLSLLERYIEMIAMDLQETKAKLREREKCDCLLSCTFNGTRYADKSSWSNQCDICSCQSGQISCVPQKCPPLICDDPIQIPGQCCPVCMKKCKYNNGLLKHGQKFTTQAGAKECRCKDGLIKCETSTNRPTQRVANLLLPTVANDFNNRTISTVAQPEKASVVAPAQHAVPSPDSAVPGANSS